MAEQRLTLDSVPQPSCRAVSSSSGCMAERVSAQHNAFRLHYREILSFSCSACYNLRLPDGLAVLLHSVSFYKAENLQRAASSPDFQEQRMILI